MFSKIDKVNVKYCIESYNEIYFYNKSLLCNNNYFETEWVFIKQKKYVFLAKKKKNTVYRCFFRINTFCQLFRIKTNMHFCHLIYKDDLCINCTSFDAQMDQCSKLYKHESLVLWKKCDSAFRLLSEIIAKPHHQFIIISSQPANLFGILKRNREKVALSINMA